MAAVPLKSRSNPDDGLPQVISCKVAFLRKQNFENFKEWAAQPGHVYIGRNMTQYIPGAVGSKWGNPFTQGSGMTLEERIHAYEAMVRSSPELMAALVELEGATQLGCWCAPNPCHGNVLVRLLRERRGAFLDPSEGSKALAPKSNASQEATLPPLQEHCDVAHVNSIALPSVKSAEQAPPSVPAESAPEKRPKKKNRLQ
ncbi:Hypothetical protein, putative [Bodo saltans]|uniref:DUF4326 domain-containing protein n=1 Tax=Bodo saltans TaxID=75058 RepID=A0A0S4J5R9_BODSA|nr:Hypothetical protein, putative [Bodo saltans]|eukprot:CUG86523.1 Hypothetical protein, putative [Bodo saltans]